VGNISGAFKEGEGGDCPSDKILTVLGAAVLSQNV